MKRAAVSLAILGFMGLAIVGALRGLPPLVCSLRALVGAAAIYALVMVAGRIIIRLVVDALLVGHQQRKDESGERAG